MYTDCPDCDTRFRVTADQLKVAGGLVRCGRCMTAFNALERLIEAPHTEHPPSDGAPSDSAPSDESHTAMATEQTPPELGLDQETSDRDAEQMDSEAPAPPEDDNYHAHLVQELEARAQARGRGWRTFFWSTLSLLMLAVLAGQGAYLLRDQIVLHYPETRPWLEELCALADCRLLPQRDPAAIQLTERDIRSHPELQGALLITGRMTNTAAFAQPYPLLELTLSDLRGQPVAGRRFPPEFYLGGTPDGLMAPGARHELRLEVLDPGEHAVNFEFDFR